MPRRIVVANQKGGVAKTTTAVNLSAYLGILEKKVLLIDLDPQANATSGLGLNKENIEKSVYEVIMGKEPMENVISKTSVPNVDVLPGNLALVGSEIELVNTEQRESRLAEALNRCYQVQSYDYVVLDTPPSLGLLTINAMTAADSVLIPMQCEYYALEGLAQLYKTIQLVRQRTNPHLFIEGLVFSMVDPRSNLTIQVMAEVKKFLKEKVYHTIIPRNIRLAEAPGFGKPISIYDKGSRGADAYKKLANEFIARHQASVETPAPSEVVTPAEVVSNP